MAKPLSTALKELRIHFCQTGLASKGARSFVEACYPSLKKCNPALPILIRECSGVQPKVWFRFAKGEEKCLPIANCQEDEILQKIVAIGCSQ